MTKTENIGRPRQFDHDDVIHAAMEVFWSNGFEASSAQDLCEQTGLGRGSLYNTFGSKQKLYEAALLHYQKTGFAMQKRLLEGEGSAKECLRRLLQWAVDADLKSNGSRGCMALFAAFERGGKDPFVAKITQTYATKLEEVLCKLFTEGQQMGEFSAARSASEMARAFLASYYGLRILGNMMHEASFLQDSLEGILACY